jgi:hypothetical protein
MCRAVIPDQGDRNSRRQRSEMWRAVIPDQGDRNSRRQRSEMWRVVISDQGDRNSGPGLGAVDHELVEGFHAGLLVVRRGLDPVFDSV